MRRRWHVDGTTERSARRGPVQKIEITLYQRRKRRAGDGNRNRMTSLEVVLWLAVKSAELGVLLFASGRG
jgi:hypothetical protein